MDMLSTPPAQAPEDAGFVDTITGSVHSASPNWRQGLNLYRYGLHLFLPQSFYSD